MEDIVPNEISTQNSTPITVLLGAGAPDGALARLAAPEAEAIIGEPVKVLAGGTAAWRAAGLPLEAGGERMASAPDDVWLKPYHHSGGVEARMKEYLDWELGLVEQIERDGDARFLTAGG